MRLAILAIAWLALPGDSLSALRPAAAESRLLRSTGDVAALPAHLDSASLLQLLKQFRARKDWRAAQATLWSAATRDALVQPIHANIVIAALADVAGWEEALMLLEQMPSLGLEPDVYSFSAAISACSRARQPDSALRIFKTMTASGVTPNQVCFNAALAACQRTKRYDELLALFGAMPAHGLQPNPWAYSAAIDALSRRGQWERALRLLDELELSSQAKQAAPPELHCYGAAMRACLRVGKHAAVLSLHERLKAAGLAPNSHTLASALAAAAALPAAAPRAQGAGGGEQQAAGGGEQQLAGGGEQQPAGGWQLAIAMLREAEDVANVHCFSVAMRACERAGRWQEAYELLDWMGRLGVSPNAHTYAAAVGAHAASARWREALSLLERMGTEGVRADGHVATAALVACGRAGECQAALDLLTRRMPQMGIAVSAFHLHAVLRACAGAGEWRDALRLLRHAINSEVSLDSTFIELGLDVCARAGAWKLALRLLRLLTSAGMPLNERMRCSAIAAMGRGGEWQLALRLLSSSRDVACHNAALSALRRAGQLDAAEALLRRMHESGPAPDTVTGRIAQQLRATARRHRQPSSSSGEAVDCARRGSSG